MRAGLRIAAVLGLCAFACAKRPMSDATAPAGGGDAPALGQGMATETSATPELEHEGKAMAPDADAVASLEEMTAELDRFETELRAQGVRLKTYRKDSKGKEHPRRTTTTPTSRTPTTGPKKAEGARDEDPCARICTIATTVCGLRDRICALAEEHTDEARYAAACKRARNDCTRATEACDDCG